MFRSIPNPFSRLTQVLRRAAITELFAVIFYGQDKGIKKNHIFLSLKMEPISCSETSVQHFHKSGDHNINSF